MKNCRTGPAPEPGPGSPGPAAAAGPPGFGLLAPASSLNGKRHSLRHRPSPCRPAWAMGLLIGAAPALQAGAAAPLLPATYVGCRAGTGSSRWGSVVGARLSPGAGPPPETWPHRLPVAQPGAGQLCGPQHWTEGFPGVSGALDPRRGLGPDLALSSCPSPCVSASAHRDEILRVYPTQCAPPLLLPPRTRQSREADLRLGVGQGGRVPHRGSFSRGAGCRGADLEVSRACGRVVGVTWQGGAGAHGAAGEGLPRGLWDRAGGGEEAATGQRARVGDGGVLD